MTCSSNVLLSYHVFLHTNKGRSRTHSDLHVLVQRTSAVCGRFHTYIPSPDMLESITTSSLLLERSLPRAWQLARPRKTLLRLRRLLLRRLRRFLLLRGQCGLRDTTSDVQRRRGETGRVP